MVPEDDFAFVVLTNADRGDLVCGEISRWVRREFLDVEEEEPEPPPPARARFYARDRIILVDGTHKGARAEFLRGPQGRIRWLRTGRVYARQDG